VKGSPNVKLLLCASICLGGVFALRLSAQPSDERDVLAGTHLGRGLDMGVNSSGGRTDWLSQDDGAMKMTYPAKQSWGAVFITFGKPKNPPRPSIDVSRFGFLVLEVRGDRGAKVAVGIKDSTQPDDGTEQKVAVPLSEEYRTYVIPLAKFKRADLHRIYVLTEFVFEGARPRTVWVRRIKYAAHVDQGIGIMVK
jgi:hypothetical protein